ncbi:hypothetical protein [Solidesulfovibrio sp.]
MRVFASSVLIASCLLTGAVSVRAQEPQARPTPAAAGSKAPAPAPAPAKAGQPGTARSDAAEARYRDWVEKEHARDASEFNQDKSKIEGKYKGYVRPKREKKAGDTGKPAAKGTPGN